MPQSEGNHLYMSGNNLPNLVWNYILWNYIGLSLNLLKYVLYVVNKHLNLLDVKYVKIKQIVGLQLFSSFCTCLGPSEGEEN